MARTDDRQAINARRVSVVEYGPDPRGWGMFARLSGFLQRGHAGREGRRVIDTQESFSGAVATAPQSFSGMAPLGRARPLTADTAELSDERAAGALEDGALRIFAERLARGR